MLLLNAELGVEGRKEGERGDEVLDKLENKLASLAHSSEDRSTARNRDPTNRLRPLNSLFGKARARLPAFPPARALPFYPLNSSPSN